MHTHKLKDSQSDVSAHQSIFNAVSRTQSRGEKLNNSSVFHFCRRPRAQVSSSTGKRSEGGLASTLFAVRLPPRRQTPLNLTPLKKKKQRGQETEDGEKRSGAERAACSAPLHNQSRCLRQRRRKKDKSFSRCRHLQMRPGGNT